MQTDQTIQVEVRDSFEELQPIQAEWDEFVESVGSEIFLTYDWCRIWWKYYGKNRDLRVFIFRSGSKLVGIIPLFFEKIRLGPVSVRVSKIVGSDFTISHFSLPIQPECMNEIISILADLLSKCTYSVICIGPIAGLYKQYRGLIDALSQSMGYSHSVVGSKIGVHTYYRLTGTWESYLSGLHKKERQLIRNAYRRIERKKGLDLTTRYASVSDVREMFDAFVETHQSHWQKLGKAGHFGDWPCSREFHRELAVTQQERRRLRLLEVRLSDDCCGYQYSYRFGYMYLSLLPARPRGDGAAEIATGKVIFSEQAKNAIGEGVEYIDSMQARYDYKLRLGGELLPMRTIYIIPRNIVAKGHVSLFRFLAKLLDLCYFKIWYCRIAPRIPLKHRPLWRIWIRSNAFAG